MKNIESRVVKLEQQIPSNDFLVVLTRKGEDQQSAIKRTLREIESIRSAEDFFIIYLNLHGKES